MEDNSTVLYTPTKLPKFLIKLGFLFGTKNYQIKGKKNFKLCIKSWKNATDLSHEFIKDLVKLEELRNITKKLGKLNVFINY